MVPFSQLCTWRLRLNTRLSIISNHSSLSNLSSSSNGEWYSSWTLTSCLKTSQTVLVPFTLLLCSLINKLHYLWHQIAWTHLYFSLVYNVNSFQLCPLSVNFILLATHPSNATAPTCWWSSFFCSSPSYQPQL